MTSTYQSPPSNPNSPAVSVVRQTYQSAASHPNSPAVSIIRPTYQGLSSLANSPASSVLHPAYHSPPTNLRSPIHSVLHSGFQPTHTQQCHSAVMQMLYPAAAVVLQRVEAQSAVDVESYVRALGDKRYVVVKESRRAALFRRTRTESGATELDDATIRRITNLASAEASRAKKEFIMHELHSQLKKKSEDAVILANELRRILAHAEQVGNAKSRLEAQLHYERFGYNPFMPTHTLHTQMNGQTVNVAPTMQDNTPLFFSKDFLPHSVDQFLHEPNTGMRQDHDQSEYSCAMDQGHFQDGTPATPGTVITATTECGLSPDKRQAPETFQAFELDNNLKMEALMCPPNIDSCYGVDEAKLNALQSSLPPLQPDVAESLELCVSNPRNQLTVAG